MSTALSRLNSFLDSELEQMLCLGTAIDAEKFCNEKSAIFIILPEEDTSKYFMVLYLGLLSFTQYPLLSVGICLSANEIPRIAQMFGLDTSVRVNMMSVSHTVSMGTKAVNMIRGGGK